MPRSRQGRESVLTMRQLKRMKSQHHYGDMQAINLRVIGPVGLLLVLISLACGAPLLSSPESTATHSMLSIEVTVVPLPTLEQPTSQPTPTKLPTITLSVVEGGRPLPTLLPTDTPSFKPTPTLSPSVAPEPLEFSEPEITSTSTITSSQAEASAFGAASLFPDWPPDNGLIKLIELPDGLELPADVRAVDFKWVWDESSVCSPLPDDQGFDIRIWPDLPQYKPMGVADVKEMQEKIVCDEKSGTRTYQVGHLRFTPGVQEMGSGQFRWHVALVELTEPFAPIAVSKSRTFQLLPDPTTPTPTLTPIPRVTPAGSDGGVGGEIILVEPQHLVEVPPADKTVEFKWRWTGTDGCEQPPEGYGFEVRIWPEHPDFQPMGAMGDAAQSQNSIGCDPGNYNRNYVLYDFKNAPGIKPAGAGRFRWHVILFKEEPYEEVLLSETRLFILPGISKLE